MSDDFNFDTLTPEQVATDEWTDADSAIQPDTVAPTYNIDNAPSQDDPEDETEVITDVAPPPKPGTYAMVVTHVDGTAKDKDNRVGGFDHDNVTTFTLKTGQTHYVICVDFQLVDGDGNKIGRSRREWLSTMKGWDKNSSLVGTVLSCMGLKIPIDSKQKVIALTKALDAGRGKISVKTEWEAVERGGHMEEGKAKKQYETLLYRQSEFPTFKLGDKTYYKPVEQAKRRKSDEMVEAITRWRVDKYILPGRG